MKLSYREKAIKKKITIEDKEYLIELKYLCNLRLYIKVRQKGKRKWEDMKLLDKEREKLNKLYWKKKEALYYAYWLDCLRLRIPTLDSILRELKKELAKKLSEKLKKDILKSEIY